LNPFGSTALERMFSRRGNRRIESQILHEHRCIAWCRAGLGGKLQAILSGVRRLVLMATGPTDKERVRIPLPHSLFFLYYLIRPIRLGMKWLILKSVVHVLGWLGKAAGKTA